MDLAQSRAWYQKAAEQELPLAQVRLARMLLSGEGGGRDPAAATPMAGARRRQGRSRGQGAARHRVPARRQGHARRPQGRDAVAGGGDVGLLRSPRCNSAISTPAATRWRRGRRTPCAGTRIAAEAGQSEAQYILGVMYRHGRVVAQDAAQAAVWFARAAESGMSAAQFDLGVHVLHRRGRRARRVARRRIVSAWRPRPGTSTACTIGA